MYLCTLLDMAEALVGTMMPIVNSEVAVFEQPYIYKTKQKRRHECVSMCVYYIPLRLTTSQG